MYVDRVRHYSKWDFLRDVEKQSKADSQTEGGPKIQHLCSRFRTYADMREDLHFLSLFSMQHVSLRLFFFFTTGSCVLFCKASDVSSGAKQTSLAVLFLLLQEMTVSRRWPFCVNLPNKRVYLSRYRKDTKRHSFVLWLRGFDYKHQPTRPYLECEISKILRREQRKKKGLII